MPFALILFPLRIFLSEKKSEIWRKQAGEKDSDRNLCPNCGLDILNATYCVRCGEDLQPRELTVPTPDASATRQKMKLFLFSIFPGLGYVSVTITSLICFVAAYFLCFLSGKMLENISLGGARYFLFPALVSGIPGILIGATGILFLLNGKIGNPITAFYELGYR